MTTFHGPPLDAVAGIGALTLGGFLDEVAERFGPNEALVFDDPLRDGDTVRWTYADLLAEAARVGRGAARPRRRARRRASGSSWATGPRRWRRSSAPRLAGAVAVPLSTFAPAARAGASCSSAPTSRVVLTQERLLGRRFGDDARGRSRRPAAPAPRRRRRRRRRGTRSSPARDEPTPPSTQRTPSRPTTTALVIFSSGTTSTPEGDAPRATGPPTLQFWVQAQIFGRHEQTRMWTSLPMFWTAGLNTAMGSTLAAGGCWVMQETFEPGEALAPDGTGAGHRALHAPPPDRRPRGAPRLGDHRPVVAHAACTASRPSPATPRCTGDTDLAHAGRLRPVGDVRVLLRPLVGHAPRRHGRGAWAGCSPATSCASSTPTPARVLGVGEIGELAVKGPTLMQGYLGQPPEECFDADGFFRTGDAGFVDADGFVHFEGRRTEMIKTGGANVSPAELEVQLRACAPVKLTRIVGVPDPRLDQIVVACITLKEGAEATEDDIQSFLRERVASYKVPKRVLFFDDGEIPMTSSDTKVRDDALVALVDRSASPPNPSTPTAGDR